MQQLALTTFTGIQGVGGSTTATASAGSGSSTAAPPPPAVRADVVQVNVTFDTIGGAAALYLRALSSMQQQVQLAFLSVAMVGDWCQCWK